MILLIQNKFVFYLLIYVPTRFQTISTVIQFWFDTLFGLVYLDLHVSSAVGNVFYLALIVRCLEQYYPGSYLLAFLYLSLGFPSAPVMHEVLFVLSR